MGTEFVLNDNTVKLGNKVLQYLANGCRGCVAAA